ncbi:MAG: EAL domain-containing protein [Lachnospiraceae bacterium]|nr:EAL domain-containing protein [Lachnospiraceae bacterium]
MLYNIHYDIAATLVLLILLYFTLSRKGIKKPQHMMFFIVVLNGLVSCIFDIASSIAISYPEKTSVLCRDILNFLYLATHNMQALLLCLYILTTTGVYITKNKRFFRLIATPYLITLIALFLNPVFRWVFYYNADDMYTHGPAMIYLYASAFLYICIALYYVITKGKAIPKDKLAALVVFAIGGIGSVVIQMMFSTILIEMFVQSLSFLGVLFTLENEADIYNAISKVYNRRAFLEDNDIYIKSKIDYSVVSVKLTNINNYQNVLGILAMNEVRYNIAQWMRSFTKNSVVYDCEKDNFCLSLYCISHADIADIAEKIQKKFETPWTYNEYELDLRIHISIIDIPETADSLEALLAVVDSNKALGDEIIMRGAELKKLQRSNEVANAIQKALDNHSFQVYYQPIWNKEMGRVNSAEALVRLFDDELGEIKPDEFIPIAENNGLIVKVGEVVFRKACEFYRDNDLHRYGIEYIEVNLSTVQCMYTGLPETFKRILKEYDLTPIRFNLEITESVAVHSPDIFLDTMHRLKEQGFTFSMDDYGTGYSNFSYMFDMEFDIIKLDKSILWNADTNENAQTILSCTVRMLKDMNFKVLIEGVETKEQLDKVVSLGVDYCQGYYFSRPVPGEQFVAFCQAMA